MKIMEEYNVYWQDLYPSNSELTIFKTRNRLFHSSKHPSPETIDKELIRLQVLLSRIILKMLGWDDISEVRDARDFSYLVK